MVDIEQYSKPFEFTLPEDRAKGLANLQLALEDPASYNSYILAQRNLLDGIITVSQFIAENQIPHQKKPLSISRFNCVMPEQNCTDTAAAQLFVCGAIGVTAFANFDGKHASTIVKESDETFTILGAAGHKRTNAKYSEDPTAKTTAGVIAGFADNAIALQLQYPGEENEFCWDISYFDGIEIRQATKDALALQPIERKICRSSVLVKPPLAFSMLRAIDVLEFLKRYRHSPDASENYETAKTALRHLVPILPYIK